MKINWGNGILIAFILFIGFILFFVIKVTTDKTYDYNLVSEEYYQDELKYQDEIDKYSNAKEAGIALKFEKTPEGIEISFPDKYQTENIKGNVSLYRPSNQRLDTDIPFVLSNTTSLLIPDNKLVSGRWDIKVSWRENKEEYLYKKEFTY
ncbi:MAG: FixH family protein [Flavobacteriaceae bacterium]|nr:FixH family protein [Flavobacteriaceae bacterium]